MAFLPTPRAVKLEFNATQNGIPVVNVLHIKTPGSVTAADLTAIVGFAQTFFGNLKTVLHSSYILQNITVTDISTPFGIQQIDTTLAGTTGMVTGAPMAANAAMVASLRTPFTGKSFRGRIYFGGLPEASLADAQTFTSGAATAISGALAAFMSALSGAGYALGVLSKFTLGALRLIGILTDITALIVDTKVDSQRRRTAN